LSLTAPVQPDPIDAAALASTLDRELEGEVRFDALSRGRYSTDASMYQIQPIGVVIPRNAADVRRAIDIAAQYEVSLLPRGAGTSQAGQTVGHSLVLDSSKYLTGQEEMGSPTLPSLVNQHKSLLASKMVLIMDGTRHVSNLPTLNFGARGIATITLKVFGPQSELHSGQYGNYAPNPVFKLARILAGMKDENGRVLIPGFYHGVSLSDAEKEQINNMPASDGDLNYRLGIAANEKVGHTYEESLQYPSLNIRGIRAADVGTAARTVIPADAIAEIDLRLVPETPAERQVGLLKNYIEAMGFHFVDGFPTPEERSQFDDLISFEYRIGSKPFRTDLNGAAGLWLTAAMDRTFGRGNYVKQRTTGGSQPIEPFITALGIPAVSLRIPNPDNNIHAANENLRIGNLQEGIQMCLGVLTQPLK
jgi:acetylornithine deacetylase/succinyl-diaminopimelate desuccinylase-like protein